MVVFNNFIHVRAFTEYFISITSFPIALSHSQAIKICITEFSLAYITALLQIFNKISYSCCRLREQ